METDEKYILIVLLEFRNLKKIHFIIYVSVYLKLSHLKSNHSLTWKTIFSINGGMKLATFLL